MFFKKNMTANYYDCDAANNLKISAAMRYMQQTSSEHLESLDISPVKLYKEGMVFLLSKMCIKVHKMPFVSDEIVVGTAATKTIGARFVREFIIETPDSQRLLSGISLWILVNPESRKILRPASFPYPLPFTSTIIDGDVEDIAMPKQLGDGKSIKRDIPICYSHIDTNGHVNNSTYADFICDCLPYTQLIENSIDTLVISFHNEIRHGETLSVTMNVLDADGMQFYFGGMNGDNQCFEAFAQIK